MENLMYRVEVVASGEVRDKDGNLVNNVDAVGAHELSADQLREMGLPVPPHPDEEK
jgi:hypothetical protein